MCRPSSRPNCFFHPRTSKQKVNNKAERATIISIDLWKTPLPQCLVRVSWDLPLEAFPPSRRIFHVSLFTGRAIRGWQYCCMYVITYQAFFRIPMSYASSSIWPGRRDYDSLIVGRINICLTLWQYPLGLCWVRGCGIWNLPTSCATSSRALPNRPESGTLERSAHAIHRYVSR